MIDLANKPMPPRPGQATLTQAQNQCMATLTQVHVCCVCAGRAGAYLPTAAALGDCSRVAACEPHLCGHEHHRLAVGMAFSVCVSVCLCSV